MLAAVLELIPRAVLQDVKSIQRTKSSVCHQGAYADFRCSGEGVVVSRKGFCIA